MGTIMTFYEQMIDLWQNMFEGERKFIFFVVFCMITFAVPFLLIWLHLGFINLCSFTILRRKHPEEWKWINEMRKRGGYKVYKNWIQGKNGCDGPIWRVFHGHEVFGKVCLGIWFIIVFTVGVFALIKNYVL
jgi:hypothetical protein